MKGNGQFADRPTILCVDNDPRVLWSLERVFRQDGWRVLLAFQCIDAIEILANQSVQVIFCNETMFDMDSSAFLSQTKKLAPNAPRVLLVANVPNHKMTHDKQLELEISQVVTRPWRDADVREIASTAIGCDPKTWTPHGTHNPQAAKLT